MYSNKFVMCVLVNGQPQTEKASGIVTLPFGTEYALRFRNKHDRRAVVKIYIDGENVSGNGYIIGANDYVDIKRHHDKDRAFKFVSLDSPDAVDFGKNGPNEDKTKGLIEARFYLEKERPVVQHIHHYHPPVFIPPVPPVEHHHHYYPPLKPLDTNPQPEVWFSSNAGTHIRSTTDDGPRSMCSNDTQGTKGYSECSRTRSRSIRASSCSCNPAPQVALNEQPPVMDGCTVEGSVSGQQFYTSYIDTEDSYTSVKVFLQGFRPGVQEAATTTVEEAGDAKYCHNCGAKMAKKSANFCHVCGTKL